MAEAQRNLTKEDLLGLLRAADSGRAFGGFDVNQAKQLPTYLPQDIDSTFAVSPSTPSVQSQVPAAPVTPVDGEQLRHSMTQAAPPGAPTSAPLAPAAGAQPPMAPPLAGPPSPTDEYELSMMPGAGSYAGRLALGETQRGAAMESLTGTNRIANAQLNAKGIAEEAKGEREGIEVKRLRDIDQHAIDEKATSLAEEQAQLQQRVAQRAQMATDQQMMRVQQAADEASQASIHNFWEDKSTGARVLGILAQMFAGAANGLAGNPSAPTPLDRVIARDMEMQQLNLQQKNRNLENQRSVLRDIYDKVGSQQQANAAYYIAAWKRVEAQGNALKTKYASKEADAAFDKLKGIADQRTAMANDKTSAALYSTSIQQQQHGINILSEGEGRNIAQQALAAKNGQQTRFKLPGFKGDVDGETYTKFKEPTEGYTAVMAEARNIQQIAIDYRDGKINESVALDMYRKARSALLSAQRLVQKTGAALSPEEFKNLQAQLPELTEHFLLPASFNRDIEHQAQRITRDASIRYYTLLDGRMSGVELNDEDPDYGNVVREYRNEKVRQHRSGVR